MAKKLKKTRRRKLLIALIILAIIIYLLLKLIGGSSEGTISQSGTSNQSPAANQSGYHSYKGPYLNYQYPATLKLESKNPASTNALERELFSGETPGVNILAVSVFPIPSGGIDNDSSYIIRDRHSENYTKKVVTIKGSPVSLYLRKDYSEKTAFWLHGSNFATISLGTSQPGAPEFENQFNHIINSAVWIR